MRKGGREKTAILGLLFEAPMAFFWVYRVELALIVLCNNFAAFLITPTIYMRIYWSCIWTVWRVDAMHLRIAFLKTMMMDDTMMIQDIMVITWYNGEWWCMIQWCYMIQWWLHDIMVNDDRGYNDDTWYNVFPFSLPHGLLQCFLLLLILAHWFDWAWRIPSYHLGLDLPWWIARELTGKRGSMEYEIWEE